MRLKVGIIWLATAIMVNLNTLGDATATADNDSVVIEGIVFFYFLLLQFVCSFFYYCLFLFSFTRFLRSFFYTRYSLPNALHVFCIHCIPIFMDNFPLSINKRILITIFNSFSFIQLLLNIIKVCNLTG